MSSKARSDERLDVIIEKLNLSRLDTIVLSGVLLPLTLLSIGLIINWVLNPPFRTIQGLNMLVIAVNFMSLTFFLPLIWYASAYLTDNMNFRLQAIKALLVTLSFAGSLAIFLGAEILLLFLKSKLPQYDTIITFSIGAFVVVFGAFAVVATFGFSFIILLRLASWLRKSMPKRVKREKMHLTPFLQVFITIHPIMFAFLAGLSVVALVAFYLFWSIAVIITSPLQDFWQEPFLIGWLFSIIPLIVFLARIRRLNRAFARLFKEQSKIVEK